MKDWLAIDKRSLGLYRILFSFLIMADVGTRFCFFMTHYSEVGVLPLSTYLNLPDDFERQWSLFFISDHPLVVGTLFVVLFLSAFSFGIGYRTRLSTFICWILLLSLQRRNPMLSYGADQHMRVLLLLGMFLPWGECYSLTQDKEEPESYFYQRLAGYCYLVQISFPYFFAVVHRTGVEWQIDGSALYYALAIEEIRSDFAPFLMHAGTDFLAFFTFAALFLEAFGPILLFLPGQWIRVSAILMIFSFHFGILITLAIGMFVPTCLVAPMGLWPKVVWENKYGQRFHRWLWNVFARLQAKWGRQADGYDAFPKLKEARHWLPVVLLSLSILYLWEGSKFKDPVTPISRVATFVGMHQRWGVFCPAPNRISHWVSVQARTKNGREVDLITGEDFRPKTYFIAARQRYHRCRWTTYFGKVIMLGEGTQSSLYLQYAVQRWNKKHPDNPVTSAQYYVYKTYTRLDYALGEEEVTIEATYP